MKYTVIGTGAIGGFYGGMLQKCGFHVDFLARSDYAHIRDGGLKIDSINGDFELERVHVYNSSDTLPETDVVLVALKTTSNPILPDLLKKVVRKGTVIVLLQNGLGMEQDVCKMFPQAIVIGGMCFICSQKRGPGYIVHMDKGAVSFAPLSPEHLSIAEKIQRDFEHADIESSVQKNLSQGRWNKLMWNIPYNGLSVVLNANTSEIMNNDWGLSLAKKIMEEVISGAESTGVKLSSDLIEKMLHFTRIMAPYEPSMKLDYDNSRLMEIEYMYRRPLKTAQQNGVALSYTQMLADQLSFLEAKYKMMSIQGQGS